MSGKTLLKALNDTFDNEVIFHLSEEKWRYSHNMPPLSFLVTNKARLVG